MIRPQQRSSGHDFTPNHPAGGRDYAAEQPGGELHLSPGAVIDERYQILGYVGSGGMSVVYRARHLLLDRIVAVKMLHGHFLRDQKSLQRFVQEAKAESAIKHPNVVSVLSVGVTETGQVYLVQDFLDGISLADVLHEGKTLPQAEAVRLFLQICDGLSAAHDHGIVHRDLKPGNIILVNDPAPNAVKIVDFGIAKLLGATEQQSITQDGNVVGTPYYMSPEQCNGQGVDAQSDIYSLGCLMYEALSGRVPFDGDSMLVVMAKHLSESPEPLTRASVNPVSPDLEDVVLKAMAKDKADRFQSVSQMRQLLEEADLTCTSRRRPPQLLTTTATTGALPVRSRVSAWQILACLAVVAVVLSVWVVQCTPLVSTVRLAILEPQYLSAVVKTASAGGAFTSQNSAALLNLARLYWQCGERDKARVAYWRLVANLPAVPVVCAGDAVEIANRAFAGNNRAVSGCLHCFAQTYLRKGLLGPAMFIARVNVEHAHGVLERAQALADLSDCYREQKEYGNAVSSLEQTLTPLRQAGPRGAPVLSEVYERLAILAGQCQRHDVAARYYQLVANLYEGRSAQCNSLRLTFLTKLAGECWLSGTDDQAERAMDQCVQVESSLRSQQKPQDLNDLVMQFTGFAASLSSKHEFAPAARCYERILACLGDDPSDPRVIAAQFHRCMCLVWDGRYAAALPQLKKLSAWLQDHPGSDLVQKQEVQEALKQCQRIGKSATTL